MEIQKSELSKLIYVSDNTLMMLLDRCEFNHIKRFFKNRKRYFLGVTEEDIERLKQLVQRSKDQLAYS